MKTYLTACGVAFSFIGFLGFFMAAMAVESMPGEMMIRAFGACAVAMLGGIACLRMGE